MTVPETAADVVRRTLGSPATLAHGRLLCVDGPAGSGKTTLAEAVRRAAPSDMSCRVLHMDDVYPGWSGLAAGVRAMTDGVLTPLAKRSPGGYRRYDWVRERLAEWVEVEPVDLLVLEGVGSGARAHAELITTLVWVEAAAETRLERGLARDGQAAHTYWLQWMRDEDRWFEADRTRDRAEVVVSTDRSPAAQPASDPTQDPAQPSA